MTSIIKVMLNASLGVLLLTGLTGCQSTGIADSNQKVDSQLSLIKTELASYGDDLFYSYPFTTSDLYQVRTMKAQGGKLVYRNGCLSLFNGSKYVTPVFPNAVTTFDNQNQILEMLQVKFNMQDMIMAGGYEQSAKEYLKQNQTVTQAPKRCLLDEVMVLDGIPDNKGRVYDGLDD